jgi:uncharacterized membrane protein
MSADLRVDDAHPRLDERAPTRRRATSTISVPALLAATSFVLYGALTWSLYIRRMANWDSAVLGQAVDGYAHLSAPIANTLGPGANQLGDHFSPILAVLAPLYRVAPHMLTLQLVQILLVSASVYILSRAAIRTLGPAQGAIIGAAYMLSFGVQSGVNEGFHELAFAAFFLTIVGERYLARSYSSAALWALPLLLVKEDMGPVVAVFAFVLLLRGARRVGAALLGVAAVHTLLTTLILIPAMNTREQYDFFSLALDGTGKPDAGVLDLLATTADPVRWVAVVLSVLVTGALCCRSPFLLLALPLFAERILAPWAYYWGPFGHYNLPAMTIVFIAAIEGLSRLSRSDDALHRRIAAGGAILGLVTSVAMLPWFALGELSSASAWRADERARAIEELTERIPDGASVQADRTLAAYLFADHNLYTFEMPHAPRPTGAGIPTDYIAIDGEGWGDEPPQPIPYARSLYPAENYDVVYQHDVITLHKRVTG